MADTIKVPGLGPVKATYVYVGGALVVGIVGYAWWKNSQQQPTDFVGASPDDFGVGDYDSPLGSSGGNSTGNYDSTDPEAIDSNAKWTVFAVEKMAQLGYNDTASVTAALAKYLARKGLTEVEIGYVQAAIAVAGLPPVGGPYAITPALPVPTPSNPDPPPVVKPPLPTKVFYLKNSNPPRWALGSPQGWQEISGTHNQALANSWAAAFEPDRNADHLTQSEWNAKKAEYTK